MAAASNKMMRNSLESIDELMNELRAAATSSSHFGGMVDSTPKQHQSEAAVNTLQDNSSSGNFQAHVYHPQILPHHLQYFSPTVLSDVSSPRGHPERHDSYLSSSSGASSRNPNLPSGPPPQGPLPDVPYSLRAAAAAQARLRSKSDGNLGGSANAMGSPAAMNHGGAPPVPSIAGVNAALANLAISASGAADLSITSAPSAASSVSFSAYDPSAAVTPSLTPSVVSTAAAAATAATHAGAGTFPTLETLIMEDNIQWGYMDLLLPPVATPESPTQQWVSHIAVLDRTHLTLYLFSAPTSSRTDPPAAVLRDIGLSPSQSIRVQSDSISFSDENAVHPAPKEWTLRGVSMRGLGSAEYEKPNQKWANALMECFFEGRSRPGGVPPAAHTPAPTAMGSATSAPATPAMVTQSLYNATATAGSRSPVSVAHSPVFNGTGSAGAGISAAASAFRHHRTTPDHVSMVSVQPSVISNGTGLGAPQDYSSAFSSASSTPPSVRTQMDQPRWDQLQQLGGPGGSGGLNSAAAAGQAQLQQLQALLQQQQLLLQQMPANGAGGSFPARAELQTGTVLNANNFGGSNLGSGGGGGGSFTLQPLQQQLSQGHSQGLSNDQFFQQQQQQQLFHAQPQQYQNQYQPQQQFSQQPVSPQYHASGGPSGSPSNHNHLHHHHNNLHNNNNNNNNNNSNNNNSSHNNSPSSFSLLSGLTSASKRSKERERDNVFASSSASMSSGGSGGGGGGGGGAGGGRSGRAGIGRKSSSSGNSGDGKPGKEDAKAVVKNLESLGFF
ncbi:hypothetical protein DFJ73DRAFT_763180 [Zopfochytrium polystomum]|nr:hypothetical protein DFJ73DRAFT_763180 [Zopfochytrium polystomum]